MVKKDGWIESLLRFLSRPANQRVLMLGFVFLISLSLFHYLWLWNSLLENHHDASWFMTLGMIHRDPWVQDVYQVLECPKLPRHSWQSIDTARALYCQLAAADSQQQRRQNNRNGQQQDQAALLRDIYRRARRTIPDPATLRHLLHQALPVQTTLRGRTVELWAPARDVGLVQALDAARDVSTWPLRVEGDGTVKTTLQESSSFFVVDVGSHLGITVLQVLLEFPHHTRVLSLEAAPPNWLYQSINLARNLPGSVLDHVTVLNVALTEHDNSTAVPFHWQAYDTAACTSWATEEAKVASQTWSLTGRTLESVLRQQNAPTTIDVLIMDCHGCEYDVIPQFFSQSSPWKVRFATGSLHWSDLPAKPSSARGNATHVALCQFPDIAQRSKECCGVASSRATLPTSFCFDFDAWAQQHQLWNVPVDTQGWIHFGGAPENQRPNKRDDDDADPPVELTAEELQMFGGDDVL